MAHRASGFLMRSMMQQKSRSFSTSSSSSSSSPPTPKPAWMNPHFAPIYVIWGFVGIVMGIASHTAYQQLRHNPNVYVGKKNRGSIVEADNPMQAVNHGGKLVDKSFLRKVAHIQEKGHEGIPNPNSATNIYTRSRHADTLDSIK